MKVRYTMLNKFFVPVAMALVSVFPLSGHAQTESAKTLDTPQYSVPDGPVNIYGQMLDPSAIQMDWVLPWSKVKDLIPELLPDAHTEVRTKEQLCEGMVALEKAYGNTLEQLWYRLAYDIAPHFPDIKDEFLLVDEVTKRLNSNDSARFMELVSMMPEGEEHKAMMARDYTQKMHAIIYIRDASLSNCPTYAAEKGYKTYEQQEAANERLRATHQQKIEGP